MLTDEQTLIYNLLFSARRHPLNCCFNAIIIIGSGKLNIYLFTLVRNKREQIPSVIIGNEHTRYSLLDRRIFLVSGRLITGAMYM